MGIISLIAILGGPIGFGFLAAKFGVDTRPGFDDHHPDWRSPQD